MTEGCRRLSTKKLKVVKNMSENTGRGNSKGEKIMDVRVQQVEYQNFETVIRKEVIKL